MKVKTIEVKLAFVVPEWVTHIAQDMDGDWFGWEKKPRMNKVGNRWGNGGDFVHIASGNENLTWWTTLREVA